MCIRLQVPRVIGSFDQAVRVPVRFEDTPFARASGFPGCFLYDSGLGILVSKPCTVQEP